MDGTELQARACYFDLALEQDTRDHPQKLPDHLQPIPALLKEQLLFHSELHSLLAHPWGAQTGTKIVVMSTDVNADPQSPKEYEHLTLVLPG